MNKIIVTEEQAREIEWSENQNIHGHLKIFHLTQFNLDLVTSARIVSGEPYEVKREFKVGDIVYFTGNDGVYPITIVEESEVNEKWYSDDFHIRARFVNENHSKYKLIVKAENREDLHQ